MYGSIPYSVFLICKAWNKYVYTSTLVIFINFSQHCETKNLLLLIGKQTNLILSKK